MTEAQKFARVRIGDIAFGGEGVGRLPDGSVVFVPFTAVGDDVTIRITETKQAFSRGEILQINAPGTGRIEPACKYFGRCGGCAYQHLDYAQEIAAKEKQFRDLLRRIGKFETIPEPAVNKAETILGYRNKLRLEPGNRRLEATGYKLDYGYFCLDNTTFLKITQCALARQELNDLLPKAIRSDWGIQNARRQAPYPMTLRVDTTGTTGIYFGKPSPKLPWLNESLLGIPYKVPTGSFWQVNPPMAEKLLQTARNWLGPIQADVLVDAYGGVGTFSLTLGQNFKRRILIEVDEAAVKAADFNHKQTEFPSQVIRGTTEEAIHDVLQSLKKNDAIVVLDPPRGGCATEVLQALKEYPVKTLLYVSCNVATLARDLRILCQEGNYTLQKTALFDMFPRTAHFESMCLLAQ